MSLFSLSPPQFGETESVSIVLQRLFLEGERERKEEEEREKREAEEVAAGQIPSASHMAVM